MAERKGEGERPRWTAGAGEAKPRGARQRREKARGPFIMFSSILQLPREKQTHPKDARTEKESEMSGRERQRGWVGGGYDPTRRAWFYFLAREELAIPVRRQNSYHHDLCFPIYRADFPCFRQEYDIPDSHDSSRCGGLGGQMSPMPYSLICF